MAPVEGIPTVVAAADISKEEAVGPSLPALADDVAKKLVTQVKHYFSDANLNQDNYMRKAVEENDGWVTFSTLSRFNRLRQMMGLPENNKGRGNKGKSRPAPVPETHIKLLATTVKDGLVETDDVEVNDDATALKRKALYVPSDAWFANTVHIKGLPYGKESADLIDTLTEYFNQFGVVKLLRLRRNPKTKAFKGNVLVEFESSEEAEDVAKSETLEFDGHKLEPALLPAYHDEKMEADEYIQPELRKPGASYPTFEEWCAAHGKQPPALPKDDKKAAAEKKTAEVEQVPGVLVRFSGVQGDIGFPALKEAFASVGDVKFVDYEKGESEGIVRFKEPVAAEVIEKNADGIKISENVVLTLSVVDGEAEKAFYERAQAASVNARSNKRQGGQNSGHRRSKRSRN
ncbi:RNA binding motif-domain-containing protein [Coemansia spiralis]|nr:RNA binding motif-domain-containing protein [Coemansia spiralis]